jgi:dTDP-4-dehydrorhamnose reductase
MKPIAIIGATGQLGRDLVSMAGRSHAIIPLTHDDIEVSDWLSVSFALETIKPDVIINCAAFHDLPACEADPDHAFQVNAIGAWHVARACHALGAMCVHISTDYIFGGDKERQPPYTEYDSPFPLSVYGTSKLAGEHLVSEATKRHLIVRTSGLYGKGGPRGKSGNFVETMLRKAEAGDRVHVVNDQTTSPTYTKDLAEKLLAMITLEAQGVYHISNAGQCTWYEFARQIFARSGYNAEDITPVATKESLVARPAYSALASVKTSPMRSWQEALAAYLQDIRR